MGATNPIMDVGLAAVPTPITLGGVGDLQLERKIGKTSGWEAESTTCEREIMAVEHRVIQKSLLRFGRQAIYRDSIPMYQSSLTFPGDDKDEDTDPTLSSCRSLCL